MIRSTGRQLWFLPALLLVCGLNPGTTHALGVLEPTLTSYLNEPLKVEIPLTLTPVEKNSDIIIQQIVGRHPNISDWVPELDFSLISDTDGNLTILATTLEPVNEPIVHFTVSIDTGSVWLQREMSFLLDPKPVQDLARTKSRVAKPKVVLKPSEALPREEISIPSAPVPTSPTEATGDDNIYIVKAGDSLSLIAQSFSQDRDATIAQEWSQFFATIGMPSSMMM